MTTGIDVVYDATHANVGSLPPGASYAGYVTGSGDVPWTSADFAKFPDAIRIAQSPALGIDEGVHADILDVETGAATLSDCAPWAQHEQAAFNSGARKGQRSPGIYASAANITNVVNALNSGGVKNGVGLWVANWNMTEPTSIADILKASGPFPVIGVQFHNAGAFDISVFSIAWLTNRSGGSVTPPPNKPPTVTTETYTATVPVLTPNLSDNQLPHWYVRRLQIVLNEVFGEKLTVDGVFGPATQNAIQRHGGHPYAAVLPSM